MHIQHSVQDCGVGDYIHLLKVLLDLQLDPVLHCGVLLLCAVEQFTP